MTDLERLRRAVWRFERADTELRRADNAGEQPRLQKAGNRYAMARIHLFNTARGAMREGMRWQASLDTK